MTDQATYIDTSCLLKLLFPEPESAAVAQLISEEFDVVVSILTRIETEQQIVARRLGGHLPKTRQFKIQARLEQLLQQDPFQQAALGTSVWELSLAQLKRTKVHCRTLDRLHLAAMAELGLRRLITHDQRQALAALDLGFEVVQPASA